MFRVEIKSSKLLSVWVIVVVMARSTVSLLNLGERLQRMSSSFSPLLSFLLLLLPHLGIALKVKNIRVMARVKAWVKVRYTRLTSSLLVGLWFGVEGKSGTDQGRPDCSGTLTPSHSRCGLPRSSWGKCAKK